MVYMINSLDQWEWKTREHVASLLHIAALGELFVSEVMQPSHTRYVPPMCVEAQLGRSPVALHVC